MHDHVTAYSTMFDWLLQPRTGFTIVTCFVGTTCSRSARAGSACSSLQPVAARAVYFVTVKPGGNVDFDHVHTLSACTCHALVVPYKVTTVTHTHFDKFNQIGAQFTFMYSGSGVPFGRHEAAPCVPVV